MRKAEFLERLRGLTAGCRAEDVAEAMQYYGEIIDDRVENGESEETVVASLGDVEAVARQIAQESGEGASLADYQEAVSPVGVTRVAVRLSDNSVALEPSPDDRVHIYYRERFGQKYVYEDRGNEVSFTDKPKTFAEIALNVLTLGLLHIHRYRTVRVQIPASFTGELDVNAGNGKIVAEAPANASFVRMYAGNGKIVWANCAVERDAVVHSSNGSVTLSGVRCCGTLDVSSSNGRVVLSDSAAGEVKASTSNCRVALDNVAAVRRLIAHTSNGAVLLTGVEAPEISADSSNGRIEAVVYGKQEEYCADVRTSNGAILLQGLKVMNQVVNPSGAKRLTAHTSNGRIAVIFRDKPESEN